MVSARSSQSIFIFLAIFLSGKSNVKGSQESCPAPGFVISSEETPKNISGSDNESGDVFPLKTWVENVTSFVCPCDIRLCIPLCCPEGYAGSSNACEGDISTFDITDLDHEESDRDYYVFADDRCPESSINSFELDHDFKLLRNGSIHFQAQSKTIDLRDYCLRRKHHSRKYSAVRCIDSNWTVLRISFIVCTSVSMFLTLAILIVYAVTPELKNLQGSICRCFLISYFASTFVLSAAVNLLLLDNFVSNADVFKDFAVLGFAYWFFACFLWMNVMSIDIWRTFRKFRLKRQNNIENREKAEFLHYSIYAWGGSVVFISLPLFCILNDSLNSIRTLVFTCWVILTFLSIVICNIFLHISTALMIRQRKKETVYMVIGMNKHQLANEQRFKFYVKLFAIMAGPPILCAVTTYWENEIFYFVLYLLIGLQGISIFLIFIRQDDVKRSFGKRFYEILRKLLCSFRRRDKIFTISK